MSSAPAVEVDARFEAAAHGQRFCLIHRPASDRPRRGVLVHAHPFAEEMNKCRRMIALTARSLAADGWTVVQPDLFGCGDSDGDFGDATIEQWVDDLAVVAERHASIDRLVLWGTRAGVLLLPPLLERGLTADLLLWQPVLSGRQHLQQFLRLSAAAVLVGSKRAADSEAPKARLDRGEVVAIAGYLLAPALALQLDRLQLVLPVGFAGRVIMLEVAATDTSMLSSALAQLAESWRAQGVAVTTEAVTGPLFWQTQEIAECATLAERTLDLLRSGEG